VDLFRVFVGDILSFVVYVAFFAGIYKLFQVATTLDEIKGLLKGQRRNEFLAQGPAAAATDSGDPLPDDAASAYAQNLLRAVNAEAQRTGAEPRQIA
jgi:hypothetical protein